jgi:hypothetical protein
MSNDPQMMGMNGMGNMGDLPFGVIPDGSVPDAGSNMTDEQAAQVGSLRRSRDDGSMNLGPGGPTQAFNGGYGGMGNGMPNPSSGMNPSFAFNPPNGQNGHSYSAQGYDYAAGNQPSVAGISNLPPSTRNSFPLYAANNTRPQVPGVWSQVFQSSTHNGFPSQYNPNYPTTQTPIKIESSLSNPSNGLYKNGYPGSSHDVVSNSDYSQWSRHNTDYYREISNQLIFFCFPQSGQITTRSTEMRAFLSADNIKHFLSEFSNFQTHFPLIHMPTFRVTEAWNGLLLAMICIGAVYSNRLAASQVREMMEFAKAMTERNSEVFNAVVAEANGTSAFDSNSFASTNSEEQLTAILLMQILFTWHGTPIQREKARQQFPYLVSWARKIQLATPKNSSPLHLPHIQVEHFTSASFIWENWVDQEKRSRLMYTIFLNDAALVVYFNTAPLLEMLEVKLPLPADDAAWEAKSNTECAEALGLHGAAGQVRNPSGSRRTKQPEMDRALKALMHSVYDLQPGTTNLFSKFILIHALHIQLWHAQRQQSQEHHAATFSTSASSTPLHQQDWVVRGADPAGSNVPSANTSGRATPVDNGGQSPMTQQHLKTTKNAFDKWKKAWDEDMAAQYPPSADMERRFGFCRDGVHFYWLFKMMLQGNMDHQMAPDQRFGHVINMLKQVKTYVVSDSARRGEPLGSVNDIDKDFGAKDLTLDMTQVFRPIDSQTNSPATGVQIKYENGN